MVRVWFMHDDGKRFRLDDLTVDYCLYVIRHDNLGTYCGFWRSPTTQEWVPRFRFSRTVGHGAWSAPAIELTRAAEELLKVQQHELDAYLVKIIDPTYQPKRK